MESAPTPAFTTCCAVSASRNNPQTTKGLSHLARRLPKKKRLKPRSLSYRLRADQFHRAADGLFCGTPLDENRSARSRASCLKPGRTSVIHSFPAKHAFTNDRAVVPACRSGGGFRRVHCLRAAGSGRPSVRDHLRCDRDARRRAVLLQSHPAWLNGLERTGDRTQHRKATSVRAGRRQGSESLRSGKAGDEG